ncbi:MAG: hypothetical protein ACRD1C_14475 [Terriglobales bacterium]
MVRTGGRWKRTCQHGRHLASGLPVCRLRAHQIIDRIPHSRSYQVTPEGLSIALFLTRVTQRFLIPGLAQLTATGPPGSPLRQADRACKAAITDLAQQASIAA